MRIKVRLNPIPTVPGQVGIVVAPDLQPTKVRGSQGGIVGGMSEITFAPTIESDDPVGKWKVVKVTFRPNSSTETAELNVQGEIAFTVVETKPVLPKTADVQIQ